MSIPTTEAEIKAVFADKAVSLHPVNFFSYASVSIHSSERPSHLAGGVKARADRRNSLWDVCLPRLSSIPFLREYKYTSSRPASYRRHLLLSKSAPPQCFMSHLVADPQPFIHYASYTY